MLIRWYSSNRFLKNTCTFARNICHFLFPKFEVQARSKGSMADNNPNRTNLIVNYLPQTLTDDEFHSMFRSIGAIKSYKIVRDKNTNYSYGFGFVDFYSTADADKAIEMLNGIQLQNKTIKVALARPPGESTKQANLYIRNIPKTVTAEELQEAFQQYGQIINVRILTDTATGQSKGVGFVLYNRQDEAENAIQNWNNRPLREGAQPLSVKFAEDHSIKNKPPPQVPMMTHFNQNAGRFPGGPMRNMQGRHRFNPMSMNAGHHYGHQDMGMGGGMAGASGMNGSEDCTLFVYNIGPDTNEKALWALFSTYGTVAKVNVMYDYQKGEGQTKNYGFVTMSNSDEAQMAMACLNGYKYNRGRPLTVSIRKDNQMKPGGGYNQYGM